MSETKTSKTLSKSSEISPKIIKRPEIIGISGNMGSGKDYVALNFVLLFLLRLGIPSIILCFADHFKIDVVTKDGVEYDKVFGSERDEETRIKLQIKGTEEGRNKYGHDIWNRTMLTWINLHKSRGIKCFIICDIRFPNEIEFVKSQGGIVIRLDAPDRVKARSEKETKTGSGKVSGIMSHSSETSLTKEMKDLYDYIVDNSTSNEKNVPEIIENIMIKHFT